MDKKESKDKSIYISLIVIILIVLVFAISSLIWKKEIVGLAIGENPKTPPVPATGPIILSSPVAGYYFPSASGGRINLWDNNGKVYVYNHGNEMWYDKTSEIKTGVIVSNFIAKTGYYFPSATGGRINLFGLAGSVRKFYVYNPNNQVWYDRTNEIANMRLPTNVLPNVGYYDPFIARPVLWYGKNKHVLNAGGTYFIFSPGYFSLDPLFSPIVGYYSSLDNTINVINSIGKRYVKSAAGWTEDNPVGLPSTGLTEGYYDEFQKKVILWYGNNVYVSSDNQYFELSPSYINSWGYSLENLPKQSEVFKNIYRFDFWVKIGEELPDLELCEDNSEKIIACAFNKEDFQSFQSCKTIIKDNLVNKISYGKSDNEKIIFVPDNILNELDIINEQIEIGVIPTDCSKNLLTGDYICTRINQMLENEGLLDEFLDPNLEGKGTLVCDISYDVMNPADFYANHEFDKISLSDLRNTESNEEAKIIFVLLNNCRGRRLCNSNINGDTNCIIG